MQLINRYINNDILINLFNCFDLLFYPYSVGLQIFKNIKRSPPPPFLYDLLCYKANHAYFFRCAFKLSF